MTIDRQKRILDNYDAYINGTGGNPCICVHGKRGTGKTALLNDLMNSLLTRGANVYFAIDRHKEKRVAASKDSITRGEDSAIRELLRQLVRMHGEKYDSDFVNFIMSYVKRTAASGLEGSTVRQYGKDSLIKFIYDCLKSEETIFIIDDLDKADTFTINLIGNLMKINALSYLIFSHSDKLVNKVLTDMLYRYAEQIKYVELRVNDDIFAYGNSIINDIQNELDSLTGEIASVPDETVLVLSKPGKERQLIRHYMKSAQTLAGQMAFEKAAVTYQAALDVFSSLADKNPDDTIMKAELLTSLGDAQFYEKEFKKAAYSYHQAFGATDVYASPDPRAGSGSHMNMAPVALTPEISEKRVAVSIKLAECYSRLNMPGREREQIMLSEAFFCMPENRTRFYDLYKKHILKYLHLLTHLGESAIFREKLKQAYSVCLLDDKEFTCSLYCAEAYMCMENEKYEKAEELLFDAQVLAKERRGTDACDSGRLWDEVTNSLAICSEQMGKPFLSAALWKDLCKTSHDPVRVAEATVNIAMLGYEQDGNVHRAAASIKHGLDLFILTGEDQMSADIIENLRGTPLAEPLQTLTTVPVLKK